MKLKGTRFIGCDLQNTDFMETDLSMQYLKIATSVMLLSIIPTWKKSRFHYCTQLYFKILLPTV